IHIDGLKAASFLRPVTSPQLVTADEDGKVTIWNLEAGHLQSQRTFQTGGRLTSLQLDRDRRRIITVSQTGTSVFDGPVRIDTFDPDSNRHIYFDFPRTPKEVALSGDGQWLALLQDADEGRELL